MDLTVDGTKESFDYYLTMFPEGKRKWSVWDVDSAGTKICQVTSGALWGISAVVGIGHPGWAAVPALGAALFATFAAVDVAADNVAEGLWAACETVVTRDGSPTTKVFPEKKKVATQTAWDEQDEASVPSDQIADMDMNRNNISCKVGRTSIYYMAIDASVGYKTVSLGDEAGVWVLFQWESSDFKVKID
jgi:hypothetical protein